MEERVSKPESFDGISLSDLVKIYESTKKDIIVAEAHVIFLNERKTDVINAHKKLCSEQGHNFGEPTIDKNFIVGKKYVEGHYSEDCGPFGGINDSGEYDEPDYINSHYVDITAEMEVRECKNCHFKEHREPSKSAGKWCNE